MLIPDPLPQRGIPVPLRASYTGLKRFPLAGISRNNASPVFILHEDALEGRVIRSWKKPLSAIEEVSAFMSLGARHVTIIWRDSPFTFTASVRTEEWRRAVLDFFARKGVPLSDAAREAIVVSSTS